MSEISDLYITLRLVSTPFTAEALKVTAAGEEIAATFTRATGTVQADAAKASRSFGEVGVAAGRMAEETKVASAGIVSAGDRLIAEAAAIEANAGKMAAAWGRDLRAMRAETASLSRGMETAKVQTSAAWADLSAAESNHGKQIAGNLGMVGLATAAIGGVAVKMAGDYQQSTTKLVTSAGESEAGLAVVRQGMLTMAGEVGVSAGHLADAMYKVGSAGYHGAAGLGLLRAAEQGAKAEGADGVKVADALSSAMRDYYPHVEKASEVTAKSADVMSKFIGATSAGKMTFDDLAGSLNSILPVSSAANITLTDTLGVLASMTVHGISAEQATQNMADAIRHLQSPTMVMSKAMATLGIDSIDVAAKLGERGLSGTMQMLSERVKAAMPPGSDKVILQLGTALSESTPKVQALGQKLLEGSISMGEFSKEAKALDPLSAKQAASFSTLAGSYHQLGTHQISGAEVMKTYGGMMQQVMGDATGLKVALMTTGENAAYTNEAIKTISSSTADAKGNVKGWAEIQTNFNQKMSEAKAGLGALAIEVGTALLPVLTPLVKVLADAARWLGQHPAIAKALAIALGVLAVAFTVAAAAVWVMNISLFANPIFWIIAGIIAAIAVIVGLGIALYQLITHWSAVEKWLSNTWHAFINWAKGIWHDLGKWWDGLWHDIAGFFTGIWDNVAKAVSSAWDDIISWFKSIPRKIGNALDSLGSILAKLAEDGWHGFLHGIEVGFAATVHFLARLPNMMAFGLGFLAGLLTRLAIDGWHGFTHGLTVAYRATVKFFNDLPGNIDKFFTSVGNWVEARGRELIDGLTYGIAYAYGATVRFFNDLPGNIDRFVENARQWLVDRGRELLDGLTHGIEVAYNATASFFYRLPGNIWSFFNGVWDWLAWHGRALLEGLGRGISEGWDATVHWFWDLPGNIGRFFDDAGNWLFQAGKNIVEGVWRGISSGASWLWQKAKELGSSIVHGFNAGINAHSPSRLAAESGMYFVQGIALGLDNHAHIAVNAAKTLASKVAAAGSPSATVNLGMSGAGTGGMASPMVNGIPQGAGGGLTVNVIIKPEGSIYAQSDLQRDVQQIVLRYAGRNTNAGWTPAFH